MSNLSFTRDQLEDIRNGLFDTLDTHFNWGLGDKKRKAAIAIWLNAKNYDALLQRTATQSEKTLRYDNGVISDTGNPLRPIADVTPQIPYISRKLSSLTLPAHELKALCERLKVTPSQFLDGSIHTVTLATSSYDVNPVIRTDDINPSDFPTLDRMVVELSSSLETLPHNEMAAIHFSSTFSDESQPVFAWGEAINENCLANMACPCCGSESELIIDTDGISSLDVDDMMGQSEIQRLVADGELTPTTFPACYSDDGTTDVVGDSEFTPDGNASCPHCGFEGKTALFYSVHDEAWQ